MRDLLIALIQLKAMGPADKRVGICTNVGRLGDMYRYRPADIERTLELMFPHWKYFSRNPTHPIPMYVGADPKSATYAYHQADDKWNPEKEYGRLRHDLLDFLIEHATQWVNGLETGQEILLKPMRNFD